MTAEVFTARSPLVGWSLAAPGVSARELPLLGMWNVRGTACTDSRALRLGPDEWLVLTPPGEVYDGPGHVTDVSAHRTTIELTGAGVRDLLAHGCSVDLDPAVRPTGSVVETLLGQAGVIIVVRDAAILLLVRASFARYVADWLTDAVTDL